MRAVFFDVGETLVDEMRSDSLGVRTPAPEVSTDSLGVREPDPRFSQCPVEIFDAEPGEVAYAGVRADEDARPAPEASLSAIHLGRGWGRLGETPSGTIAIESRAELASRLGRAPGGRT